MSGNSHGGWDYDPDELNGQEAMFSMYNRHEQNPMSGGNHGMYGNHQQALVSRSQRRHQQQQSTVLNPNNTVPIWQSQSGFGQSPFQRLGASMMFSSSSRGYRNIFSSATTQRSRPMILLIGDSRALGTFSGFTTENMRSGTSTERVSGGPEITELPNTPEEAEKSVPEFDVTTQKIKVKGHKNKLPLTTKKMSFCENENDENEPCYHSGTNVDISNSPAFSNNEHSLDVESITAELKEENCLSCYEKVYDVSTDKSINVSDTTKLPSHIHSENKIQGTDFFKAEVADTKEHDIKRKTQAVSNVNGALGPFEKYNKEVKTKAAEEDTSQPHLQCSKDNEKSRKENPKKNKKADTANYVRKTSNKLSVNFNLGHIDKSDHTPSETLKKDEDVGHEENKLFKRKPQVVLGNSIPLLDNIIDNGNNLSANVVSQYQEESEESKCSVSNTDCHSEASTALRESPESKQTIKMKTQLVQDNEDKLTQKIDSSEDELLEEGLFQQDSSPADKSNWGSGFGGARLHADSDHIGHSNDLHEEQDMQQPPGHNGFPNDDSWHDNDSLFQSGSSDHNASLWQQDEYGKEEGKSCRYLEMVSNLRKLVSKEGLIVKDVYPDGNCLFAAVVDQLRVRGEFFYTPRTLRKAAVEHLRKYSVMPDGTPLYCFVTDASWEAYLSRMATEGEWGDHLIISAITNVLQRKLVILGGLSGLSRTVQEPDHAYKEITREWNQVNNNIPADQQIPCSDGQKEPVENKKSGSAESECQAIKLETNIEEDCESLYLGHLAESHYVSLRRQDWEERLHEILGRKATSSVLIDSKSTEGTDENASRIVGWQRLTISSHCNFLLKVIISRCMYGLEQTNLTLSDYQMSDKIEPVLIGPIPDHLYAGILSIKFETIWHRRGLYLDQNKESISNELDSNHLIIITVNDSFAAEKRRDLSNKDLLLDFSECHAGFTRLTPVKQSLWLRNVKEGSNGKYYLKQLHMVRKNAMSEQSREITPLLAFRCHWPGVASEWVTRERLHGWPSESFVSEIEATGCRIVSLSHPSSLEKDIEWMFHFGLAEQILSKEATSKIQRSCFRFLRLLIESCLGNHSKIAYSHIKSLFFYACERIEQQTWDRNPAFCMLEMIRCLANYFEARFLPCYFIKNNNLIEDFSESDLMFHRDRLKNLHRHFVVLVYFMLDTKGQILANLHSVFDNLISDYQEHNENEDLDETVSRCFLPCIVEHISLYASVKTYSTMIDLANEAASELYLTFDFKITVRELLVKVVQRLPLDKGWLFAFFVDQKLHLSLRDKVCENLSTVSVLNFLGEHILESIDAVDGDIKIPEALATVDNITSLVADFTTLLKEEFALGSERYIKSWMFFFDLHLSPVLEFIRQPSSSACPMQQHIASLNLRNAFMNIRLEVSKIEGGHLRHRLNEMESYLKLLEEK